jgi:AcrR family transcriptional regulator
MRSGRREGGLVGNAEPNGEPPAAGGPGRRRYDSPVRRERAARTRERITDAGVALVRELPTWDWRSVTFAAVAARAGVGVRTVYRYFPTERDLHDAIMSRLQQAAGGVAYEDLALDDVSRAAARLHARLPSLAVSRWAEEVPDQPTLVEVDRRRREALLAAVADKTRDWPQEELAMAAAVLDVLWGVGPYERLTTARDLVSGLPATYLQYRSIINDTISTCGPSPALRGASTGALFGMLSCPMIVCG